MLPEFLTSSYKAYKDDTTIFVTWLYETALKCGFRSPNSRREQKPTSKTSNRLKGKARKQTKGTLSETSPLAAATSYTITIKDLRAQATLVAKTVKPRHKMPAHVLEALKRAITARQRFITWFKKYGDNEHSTNTHQYFINVLESALSTLEPCWTASKPATSLDNHVNSSGRGRASHNAFEALNLEVTNEGNHVTVRGLDVTAVQYRSDREQIKKPLAVAASDPSVEEGQSSCVVRGTRPANRDDDFLHQVDEATFAIFCFFQDLHWMQGFLATVWGECAGESLDLVTAAMLTNATIDIVRRTELDLLATHRVIQQEDTKFSPYFYIIFAMFLGKVVAKNFCLMLIQNPAHLPSGADPSQFTKSKEFFEITPFTRFMYLEVARSLWKSTQGRMNGDPQASEVMAPCKLPYPQPIPSYKIYYLGFPELLPLPETQKAEREDEFLTQMLMDLALDEQLRTNPDSAQLLEPANEDELSKSLRMLVKSGYQTVGGTFAARMLLDIHDFLGEDVGRGHKELINEACRVVNLFNPSEIEDQTLQPDGATLVESESNCLLSIKTLELAKGRILQHPLGLAKEQLLKVAGKSEVYVTACPTKDVSSANVEQVLQSPATGTPDTDQHNKASWRLVEGPMLDNFLPIKPSTDPDFLYSHNPVHCGTMSLQLAISLETAALALANHHKSIFGAAHLYNALLQANLLQDRWPEMDALITFQITPLFCGELPKTFDEMHSRISLRLGASVMNKARNRRVAHQFIPSKTGLPNLICSELSTIFRPYFDDGAPIEASLSRFEKLARAKRSKATKKEAAKRQLTPLEFLAEMQEWIRQALPSLRIDYMTLTRQCTALLENVRRALDRAAAAFTWADRGQPDPGLNFLVRFIIDEARRSPRLNPDLRKLKAQGDKQPALVVASRVFGEFLRERNETTGEKDVTESIGVVAEAH